MANIKCVNPKILDDDCKWLMIAIKTVGVLAYSYNKKQEEDTHSFKARATANIDKIIFSKLKDSILILA